MKLVLLRRWHDGLPIAINPDHVVAVLYSTQVEKGSPRCELKLANEGDETLWVQGHFVTICRELQRSDAK